MGSEWQEVTIESIASRIAMGPFGSDIKTDNFVPSGVPVIRGGNLTQGRFNAEGFVFLTEQKADQLLSANAFPGDLVFTHRGTLGQVGLIPPSPYQRYVVSQSQMKLSCDPLKADPGFMYYFFKSPLGQQALLMHTSQTGVPAISRPVTSLKSIRLMLPPLPEQRAIAAVLGSLDDKIELNRRMNGTLEGLARALFRAWFVDFEPVRAKMAGRPTGLVGEIEALFPGEMEETEDGVERPRGWRVKSLDEIATYLNGLALQKYPPNGADSLPVIKIAQLRKGNTDGADRASADVPADYVIDDGDVLFSWSGSLEVVIWCGGQGALNQHLFKVTSNHYPKWYYYLWTKEHLSDFQEIAAGKATTMGHIQRKHLTQAKALVPPRELIEAMDKLMSPLIERIIWCNVESRTLATLRDTLLPGLMRGEVRVSNLENVFGVV